jgi:hypothetical protein
LLLHQQETPKSKARSELVKMWIVLKPLEGALLQWVKHLTREPRFCAAQEPLAPSAKPSFLSPILGGHIDIRHIPKQRACARATLPLEYEPRDDMAGTQLAALKA